jgi:hypothetical protein
MLAEFDKNSRPVEQVCYLDGFRTPEGNVVTTLTLPNALLAPGYFEVSSAAMSQAGKHFCSLGLIRLAQVHTHPSDWTGHSPWDDAHAYSQLPGAVSIVLPNFAHRQPILTDAGVHVRTLTGWIEVAKTDVSRYVRVIPSLLDFRPVSGGPDERVHIKPARKRSWWSLLTFRKH